MPPLRGSGSQSYSQDNGTNSPSNTLYASGATGQIQGDATRLYESAWYGTGDGGKFGASPSEFQSRMSDLDKTILSQTLDEAGIRTWLVTDITTIDTYSDFNTKKLENIVGTYTYTLNYSTSTDEDGNEHIDSIELIPEWHDALTDISRSWWIWNSNSMVMPIDNEIRPVNIAVRYFIRAR